MYNYDVRVRLNVIFMQKGEMFMQDIVDILTGVVSLIALLSPVLLKLIAYAKAKTRNEHLITAEKFAEQAVTLVSNVDGLQGSERKKTAVNALFKRLNDNGLKNNFTTEQVEQIVERAYQSLKG